MQYPNRQRASAYAVTQRILSAMSLCGLLVTLTWAVMGNTSAFGATVTVTNGSDLSNGKTSSIAALIAEDGGDGISLREAIEAANQTAGEDTITFNIAGAGPHTIQPTSALPTITEGVIIDGTTATDFTGTPVIELDGSLAGAASGLHLVAGSDGSHIQGLVINRFGNDGIDIDYSKKNTIVGNYIGTDINGTADLGNGDRGIHVRNGSSSNLIGGTTASARNVIAGNAVHGVDLIDAGTQGNVVRGNYIGVDATGSATLGNDISGIKIQLGASNNLIGGTVVGAGNVIGGNDYGVFLQHGGTLNNRVEGNFIGTDATGSVDLGHDLHGIFIAGGATANTIGGTAGGAGNRIAFSFLNGIAVFEDMTSGNNFYRNLIYDNNFQGIDLSSNGLTPNDAGDVDTGANNLQNFPVLTSVITDGANLVSLGLTLNSTANRTFRIEIFTNAIADASGHGEGETYLGAVQVTTNNSGNASFGASLSATVPVGHVVTATATDLTTHDTSEFSANATAVLGTAFIVDTTSDTADGTTSSIADLVKDKGADGLISLREALIAANNTINAASPDEIHFNIAGASPHTIQLMAALPDITDAVVIDGTTEPDFTTTPVIELDGSGAGVSANGLSLIAGSTGSSIRSLAINRFSGHGIAISGATDHVIRGNYIGTSAAGDVALGNAGSGIFIAADNVTIGGTTAGAGNVISGNAIGVSLSFANGVDIQGNTIGLNATGTASLGNTNRGIQLAFSNNITIGDTAIGARNVISGNGNMGIRLEGNSNIVQGNYIGTDVTGMLGLENGSVGIHVSGNGSLIGGNTASARNIISGNKSDGIQLSVSDTITIQGNYIGVNAAGTGALGNGLRGIALFSATNAVIGGIHTGEGNTIAHNASFGIVVSGAATTGNTISGNRIHSNLSLGLALDFDGVTANDTGDADTGGNRLQNYPVLQSAHSTGGVIAIRGTLDSTANTTYRLEFFASMAQDSSGHGEAERFLGARTIDTLATGETAFTRVLTAVVGTGEFITATATDLTTHDTSEFAFNTLSLKDDDSDSDGLPDSVEDRNLDGDNNPATGILLDTDGNGTADYLDPDNDGDGTATMGEDANSNGDPTDDDTDGDGIPDYLDPDDDGPGPGDSDSDGVADDMECPSGPPCTDTDGDGIPNYNDPDHMTAVSDLTLQAAATATGVWVTWKTGYEVNNLGFHVYREVGHAKEQITTSLVAGTALLTGAGTTMPSGNTYAWFDAAGTADDRYWVADIDIDPSHTQVLHGPIETQAAVMPLTTKTPSPPLAGLGQMRFHPTSPANTSLRRTQQVAPKVWVTTPTSPPAWEAQHLTPEARQQALAAVPALNIAIDRAGWYRVTQPELVQAGLDPGIDPRYLQLFAAGRPYPLAIESQNEKHLGPDSAIAFYAEPLDSSFTNRQRYWLVVGTQFGNAIHRMPEVDMPEVAPQQTASNFPFTVRHRPRTIYVAAVQNGARENFFGPVVTGGTVEIPLDLRALAVESTATAQIAVALQGVTPADHHVEIGINGYRVGEMTFDGQTHIRRTFSIPQAWLQTGANRLTLASKAPETERDVSVVDAIDLTYRRAYIAEATTSTLRCTLPHRHRATLDGFRDSTIRVFDITEPQRTHELSGQVSRHDERYAITTAPAHSGSRTLYAFTEPKRLSPGSLTGNPASTWHVKRQGAEMVIIAHAEMIGATSPLKTLRESQGLSVALIDVQDLYDAFTFGAKHPEAIKAFTRYAVRHWQPTPRFVLLVGAANFDPRDYLSYGPSDWIPTGWLHTELLETASDDGLVDIDGDGEPDLPIGRLPASSATEAAVMVGKLINYDTTPGSWRHRALVITAAPDDFDFLAASQPLRQRLANRFTVETLPLGQVPMTTARQQLAEGWASGYGLATYFGHGTTDRWAAEGLIDTTAIRALRNDNRLPIVLSMTCLTGFFHDPVTESLAEAFLQAPHGGAVAVWASTGLTRPPVQVKMQQLLTSHLLGPNALTLGEAILRAKQAVRDAGTWVLFGDPAMRFR